MFKSTCRFIFFANAAGQLLGIFYVLSCLPYCTSRRTRDTVTALACAGALVLMTLSLADTHALTSERQSEAAWGAAATVFLVCGYLSPLSSLVTVVRTRNAASIHLPLALTMALNGAAWLVYGLAIKRPFIYGPNSVGVAAGAVALLLRCIVFRPPRQQRLPSGAAASLLLPDSSQQSGGRARLNNKADRGKAESVNGSGGSSGAQPAPELVSDSFAMAVPPTAADHQNDCHGPTHQSQRYWQPSGSQHHDEAAAAAAEAVMMSGDDDVSRHNGGCSNPEQSACQFDHRCCIISNVAGGCSDGRPEHAACMAAAGPSAFPPAFGGSQQRQPQAAPPPSATAGSGTARSWFGRRWPWIHPPERELAADIRSSQLMQRLRRATRAAGSGTPRHGTPSADRGASGAY